MHTIYTLWSIRSLKKFDYHNIEVIVRYDKEKEFLLNHYPDLTVTVINNISLDGYLTWTLRPFAIRDYKFKDEKSDVVICDTDIIWKQDPRPLFKRFENKLWVHKITALNPTDFYLEKFSRLRTELTTFKGYAKHVGLTVMPNCTVNCGLFKINRSQLNEVFKVWCERLLQIPKEELLRTEAVLTVVLAELGISPWCDKDNIKHLERTKMDEVELPVCGFSIEETDKEKFFTGYQTATHYYGTQRPLMYKAVVEMGLDKENYLKIVNREELVKKIKNLKTIPARAVRKIKRMISE